MLRRVPAAAVSAPVEISGQDALAGSALLVALGAALPLLSHPPGLPCPLRTFTGVPCPLCGMTTGVEATLYGHPLQAASANPAAPLLVASAVYAIARRPARVVAPAWLLVLLAACSWLFELYRFDLL
jgi:hypothetical protein